MKEQNKKQNADIVDLAARAVLETAVPDGPPREAISAVEAAGGTIKFKQRKFTMNRIIKIAAAIIVIAVLSTSAYFLAREGTGVAFAQVRQQIQQARTVTYNMTMIMEMPTSGESKELKLQIKSAYKEPGFARQTVTMDVKNTKVVITNISDFTKGMMLSINPAQKMAVTTNFGELPKEVMDQQKNFVAEMKMLVEGSGQELGERVQNGEKLKGFRATKHGVEMDLWVDFETGHPILIEGKMPGIVSFTLTDIVFDEELSDELFDLTIPEGYKEHSMEMPMGNVTETDLINGLRFFAKYNDGIFPAQGTGLTPKIIENIRKERKQGKELSEEERMEMGGQIGAMVARFILFIQIQEASNTWQYFGEGVKLGDKETPICWYKPKDSETYRVVYGDLSIRDVEEADLPKIPNSGE